MTETEVTRPLGSGFAGSAPGQNLAELVERISTDSLSTIIGEDVAALVKAMPDTSDPDEALRYVSIQLLQGRAEELLSNGKVRQLLINELSHAKLTELKVTCPEKSGPGRLRDFGLF